MGESGDTAVDGKLDTAQAQDEIEKQHLSYFQLFKYSDGKEKCLIVLGMLCSVAVGAGDPIVFYLFGDVVNDMSTTAPGFAERINQRSWWFILLALLMFMMGSIQLICSHYTSMSQVQRIRQLYFQAILRQDKSWFDQRPSGALMNHLFQDINLIQKGVGDKLALFIQNISTFVIGILVAYTQGWKLALVASVMIPIIVAVFVGFGKVMHYFAQLDVVVYAKASSIAEEALAAIRTVVAYGAEEVEHTRYVEHLSEAQKVGIQRSTSIGASTGCMGFIVYMTCALICWYGMHLVITENYSGGQLIVIYINVIVGSIALGTAIPYMEFFGTARKAAFNVFETIERIPSIDVHAHGKQLDGVRGKIVFENVSYAYESRPDVKVLKNFNLTVQPGETVALIGRSGSGKSSVVHLLQRFYDPTSGKIHVDDEDIREFHLPWYRSFIGVVQQEPVLFTGSIEDNIKLGKLDATQVEVKQAAKLANAHDFIIKLSDGYQTWISHGGTSLSGGQRQRIAIARALIRDPKILLLDEATSALDTKSERMVQIALDRACTSRTVIVVAHRLSTVRQADKILVMQDGQVLESGSHDQLVQVNGVYAQMLRAQTKADEACTSKEEQLSTCQQREIEPFQLSKIDDEKAIIDSFMEKKKVTSILQLMGHMLRLSRPEAWAICLGFLGATIAALVSPAYIILYAEMFRVFTRLLTDPAEVMAQTRTIALLMIFVAVSYLIGMLMQGFFFGLSGERLTRRLRDKVYSSMLSQDIEWFDLPENQPGVLTSRLSTEASSIRNVAGFQFAILVEAFVLIVCAFIIGFVNCWQVTLMLGFFLPLLMVDGYMSYRSLSNQDGSSQDQEQRSRIAQEAFVYHRTVSTLGLEDYFAQRFNATLANNRSQYIRGLFQFSALSALSKSVLFLAFGTSFPLGAYLIQNNQANNVGVFKAFSTITFCLTSCGKVIAFIPELKRAISAGYNTLHTLSHVGKIGKDFGFTPQDPFDGNIMFRDVTFSYPTCEDTPVLKNFSHTIDVNQTHALVGQSGCGKSTLIQLALRFYDVSTKSSLTGIFINGINARQLAPRWIRQQIGLVSQEPTLFNMTIRENIAYGENTREVTEGDVIRAARQANIHDFVMTLPRAYDTEVGERGSMLSGGQKQRVAIARALIRQPRLLLLDEATSALDGESERVVQAALDQAMSNRTCLVVAHRLSTVENSDLIVVLKDGCVVEKGTANDLMAAKGAYYAMHCMEDVQ